jgi:rhodanese-related sulfurtransferase
VGQRSALAAEFAASMGFKDLYNIEGGTEAWVKAGYAVE